MARDALNGALPFRLFQGSELIDFFCLLCFTFYVLLWVLNSYAGHRVSKMIEQDIIGPISTITNQILVPSEDCQFESKTTVKTDSKQEVVVGRR